jgi:hypothetical protein
MYTSVRLVNYQISHSSKLTVAYNFTEINVLLEDKTS